MHLETLFQKLMSLNINPDDIENKRYAKAFIILFAIVEMLSKEIVSLKAEIQMLRDENNLLKGEQTKPNIRGSKKKMISLLRMKGIKGNLKKTGKIIQE
jgi:hypothetical protein